MTSSSPERPAPRLLRWLRMGANHVLVLMMAAMFVAFILQVAFRYALNLPLAWTDEVCTIVWLWGILWGASFVMRNREDIRFDMLYNVLPRRLRRGFTLVASVLICLAPALQRRLNAGYWLAQIGLVLGIVCSLLAAILLNQGLPGTAFFRTIFFLPSITPIFLAVAVAFAQPEPEAERW